MTQEGLKYGDYGNLSLKAKVLSKHVSTFSQSYRFAKRVVEAYQWTNFLFLSRRMDMSP